MTILFDLDGTLIDSTEAILSGFHHTFNSLGGDHPDDTAIKSLIGHTLEDMYLSLGVEPVRITQYVTEYKAYYRAISTQKTLLLPGAEAAIEAATSFARLGVVTTKTGVYSRELLEHFGLMKYFDVLIGREDVQYPKPHPEPVLSALCALDADPARSWLIGDTRLDAEAAARAGIGCVGVLCGYDSYEALSRVTEHIQNDAFSAVQYIAQNGGNKG